MNSEEKLKYRSLFPIKQLPGNIWLLFSHPVVEDLRWHCMFDRDYLGWVLSAKKVGYLTAHGALWSVG